MKLFALRPKPADYSLEQWQAELERLPESWIWTRSEPIILKLCPVAARLAQRTDWPRVRQSWALNWGVPLDCPLRLERR